MSNVIQGRLRKEKAVVYNLRYLSNFNILVPKSMCKLLIHCILFLNCRWKFANKTCYALTSSSNFNLVKTGTVKIWL